MAQVFGLPIVPSTMSHSPETPTKNGITVTNSEVEELRTPAPTYAEQDTTHLNHAMKYLEKTMRVGGPHQHPVNPIGNVTHDLRDHLPCHQNFNTNVEVILHRYKQLQHDHEQLQFRLGKVQRDLRRETEEKELLQMRCSELERALHEEEQSHKDTRERLSDTQRELAETHARLNSAIQQLAETVQRLEEARKALREMTRQRDALKLQVDDLKRDLDYYTARVEELKKALDEANNGENCANDRNARLTIMLFQVEAQKAEIEREKDRAQAMIRNLRDDLRDVTSRNGLEKLRKEIEKLNMDIAELEALLTDAKRDLVQRDSRIEDLEKQIEALAAEGTRLTDERDNLKEERDHLVKERDALRKERDDQDEQIEDLKVERDHIRKIKNNFRDTVDQYEREVDRLKKMDTPRVKKHKNCKKNFMVIRRPLDELVWEVSGKVFQSQVAQREATMDMEMSANTIDLDDIEELVVFLEKEDDEIDEEATAEAVAAAPEVAKPTEQLVKATADEAAAAAAPQA